VQIKPANKLIQSKKAERGDVNCQLGKSPIICRLAAVQPRLFSKRGRKTGKHQSNVKAGQMLTAALIAV